MRGSLDVGPTRARYRIGRRADSRSPDGKLPELHQCLLVRGRDGFSSSTLPSPARCRGAAARPRFSRGRARNQRGLSGAAGPRAARLQLRLRLRLMGEAAREGPLRTFTTSGCVWSILATDTWPMRVSPLRLWSPSRDCQAKGTPGGQPVSLDPQSPAGGREERVPSFQHNPRAPRRAWLEKPAKRFARGTNGSVCAPYRAPQGPAADTRPQSQLAKAHRITQYRSTVTAKRSDAAQP